VVLVAAAVASQLATDGRRGTPQGHRNFLLLGALVQQLSYAITFLVRKMVGHRWDSVPKGLRLTLTLE
jgi:hypothetical protein